MKHLLKIEKFINEALTPEFQKKYKTFFNKRSPEVQARLNNLLDNKERVYIPFISETISETQLKVKSYLEEQGYKIIDYKLNSAVQIENSKRTLRISKLLVKNPELLKEFTLDDTRANTRAGSEFMIALTSNYEDVAGMSFERCWTNSCLNIQSGLNKHYVADEVQQGTVVAYLIKGNDLEIEDPLGRVNIKPFYSLRDKNEVIYVVDRRVYGNVPDEKLFKDIINQYLKEKQEVKLVGFYDKVKGLYNDLGSPDSVLIEKGYKVCYNCKYDEEGFDRQGLDKEGYDREGYNKKGFDKEGYNREGLDRGGVSKNGDYPYKEYLTREQYSWLKKNVKKKFHVDENGFVNVDGDVRLLRTGLTKLPVKFGVVRGNFDCFENDLTSLVGAPKEVKGYFNCSSNNLTNLEGAPKEVRDFYCYNNNLTSLEGGPREVGHFNCSDNDLTNLEGAPNKVGDFNCSSNNLTNLEGAPQEVRGDFDCSDNDLTNLVGSPKEVKDFDCNDNNLTSLEGAPKEVKDFYCNDNNLTSLVGSPKEVKDFYCNDNNLTSLVGSPKEVKGNFLCPYNNLISLEGAPQEVRGYFFCYIQKNGHRFTKEDVLKVSRVDGSISV